MKGLFLFGALFASATSWLVCINVIVLATWQLLGVCTLINSAMMQHKKPWTYSCGPCARTIILPPAICFGGSAVCYRGCLLQWTDDNLLVTFVTTFLCLLHFLQQYWIVWMISSKICVCSNHRQQQVNRPYCAQRHFSWHRLVPERWHQ